MTIKRSYHFYAAHRVQSIGGKCESLHGHTYHVEITFLVPDNELVTFEFLDATVMPVIKAMDHAFIVYDLDPLHSAVQTIPNQKLYVLAVETTAENLSRHILKTVRYDLHLPAVELSLQETLSGKVIVTPNDLA